MLERSGPKKNGLQLAAALVLACGLLGLGLQKLYRRRRAAQTAH